MCDEDAYSRVRKTSAGAVTRENPYEHGILEAWEHIEELGIELGTMRCSNGN